MAVVYPGTADYVAHLPEVRAAVRRVAEPIEHAATVYLEQARAESTSQRGREHIPLHIELRQGKTDTVVSLVDDSPEEPGAVAAEFGQDNPRHGERPVEGLNIMGRAMAAAGGAP